jgi:ParB family chromosome partitioning protein
MSRYATAFGRETPAGLTSTNPNSLLSPKFSVRLDLRDEELSELAETINQVGVLEPLIARKTAAGLERVVGGRRQRAAKQAGVTAIPVIIRDMDDATAFEAQLIENLHHRELTDYELGRAFSYMLKEFKERYPSQETIAKHVGKSQGWVGQRISGYELVEEAKQDEAITRVIKPAQLEQLNEFQLRNLRDIPADKRAETLEKLTAEKPQIQTVKPFKPPVPSGRELERAAKTIKDPDTVPTGQFLHCKKCNVPLTVVHKSNKVHLLKPVREFD